MPLQLVICIFQINDINFNGMVEIVYEAIFPSQIIIGILLETIVTTLRSHLKWFCEGLSDATIFRLRGMLSSL